MTAAAHAFTWEFFRRHRWGFVVVAAYVTSLLIVPIDTASSTRFAFTVIVPATFCALYFAVVFSFGFAGDLAARESLYPSRLFTLPVTTHALASYPMLFGMSTSALLWIITAVFGLRPSGLHVPIVWPALFAAVFLGWAQALIWMPYGLRGIRVILAAAWLVMIDTAVVSAVIWKVPETTMLTLLAPQLPLAYLVARYAVTAARRGHVPDWTVPLAVARTRARQQYRRDLPSPQLWLELQQGGRTLVALVAMLLPFELLLLFGHGNSTSFVWMVLVTVLLTPPFMAACTAATMRDALTPYIATRPLSTSALIAAKLRVALMSTTFTWAAVILGTGLGLTLSHTWFAVVDVAHYLDKYFGAPRTTALALLVFAGLFASTWRQLVQSLYVGLTGRLWLMKAMVLATLALLVALVPVGGWILSNSSIMAALWRNMPWILASAVLLKLGAAAWTAARLARTGVLSERTLVKGAAVWLTSVLVLHAVLLWLLSTPQVPAYFLMLLAILAVPLARVGAAPLALAWNRHR